MSDQPKHRRATIEITPSMLKRHESTVVVSVKRPEVTVTMHWRVWLGTRLIYLGALVAGMGYRREEDGGEE